VLDGVLAELRRALAGEAGQGGRVSPIEAALTAVLSCPGGRVQARPTNGPADADEGDADEGDADEGDADEGDADEGDAPDAAAAVPGTADAGGATGTEPGGRGSVAPAPEDHAFSDMLRQAACEQDAPVATFTDPGVVAPADRELTHALVLIERTGGQNIRQAKFTIRQLLAERDRVLRERVAMRLPPVSPEKLAGVIKSLVAVLDTGSAAVTESPQTAAPPARTKPARLGAAGPT